MDLKKLIRRTANVLAVVITALSVALAAFVFISRAKGETPYLGDHTLMWVITDSMRPTISEKSYILVEKTDASQIDVGDIIVFISDDPQIAGMKNTHRVVEIVGDREEFVTRGDNNEFNDNYNAKADKIVAKYVKTLGLLSAVGRLLSTTLGLSASGVILMMTLVLLFTPELGSLKRRKELLITSAEIDGIADPQTEKALSYAFSLPEDAAYNVSEFKWLGFRSDGSAANTENGYDPDTSYAACITAEANEGHAFAEKCVFSVNGTPVTPERCGDKLIVIFSFPKS